MIDSSMRARIEAAIAEAERGTSAEFVAAIVRRADGYLGNVLMAAAFAALLAGIAVWLLAPWPGPGETMVAELLAFIMVAAIGIRTPIGVRLASMALRQSMARRLARLAFLDHGLAGTEEHCGVLFFVAEAEHYVEIIADRGIDQAVEPGAWQKIVDAFTAAVKRGEVERGFVGAIESLGALLARHYPAAEENPDRISNRLIDL